MACNAPLTAWQSREKTPLGKRGVTFDIHQGYSDMPINIACGTCTGCKLARARNWALRCTHEASLYDFNSFITLTYNDENLPKQNEIPTLEPEHFVLFMKKLRKRRTNKIRFLQAGEYGQLGRPHHHALLFNCHFPDRTAWRETSNYTIYRSKELEELWDKGHSEIGEVNFESAGYIARYTIKNTQQIKGRIPEYMTMSRRPGIGKDWLKKYISDVYPSDEIITNSGTKLRPPRYYDNQLEKINPKLLKEIKANRIATISPESKSGLRYTATEKIQRAQAQLKGGTL